MTATAARRLAFAALCLCLPSTAPMAAPPAGAIGYGIVAAQDTLIVRVISTGCTKREHFRISLDADRRLLVTRLKPDLCRAKPRPMELHFAFSELGLSGPVYFQGPRTGPITP